MVVARAELASWERLVTPDGTILRRPTLADVPGVFAVHRDPAVYRHDPQEVHPDPDHTTRFLTPMVEHWADHGWGYWVVLVPRAVWPQGEAGGDRSDADRVVAGLGGIRLHTLQGRTVLNVLYRFSPATQGRGLAGLVLDRALAMAPLVAPGVDLVVRTRPANAAAQHVAERAEFTDVGPEPGATGLWLLTRSAPAPP